MSEICEPALGSRFAASRPAENRLMRLIALLVTNAGILLVLLCGPNSPHPVVPLAYGGAALAFGGLLALVRSIIARRRNAPFPPTKAV